jgi:NADPH:quinone reductase-like Zn-dependent oxidoreductase
MKAIILKEPGGANKLEMAELPVPQIKDGEVLIQAKAISINPVDIKTRNGKSLWGRLKEEPPVILGWDVSGVVAESRSPLWQKGDEVFGMVNFPGHGKAYAEYVTAPADQLALKPASISHEEAAAATLAALTAWQMMTVHATVKPGDKVLIHAAAGGVGHYAVQIAKYLGAYVTGTSSAANRDFVLSLGADEHIDYRTTRFEDVVKDLDYVLDALGGDNIDRSLEVIRKGGTLVSIPSGMNEQLVEKAAAKGINGFFKMVQSSGTDMKVIADLLAKGVLRSHVMKSYALEDIRAAHEQVESGRTVGKIVTRMARIED